MLNQDPIPCSAGCGRTVPGMEAALLAVWEHLPITGRWRCPTCRKELEAVNKAKAPQEPTP